MQASEFYRAFIRIKKAVKEPNFESRLYLRSRADALVLTSFGPTSYAEARIKDSSKIASVCLPMEFGDLFQYILGEVTLTEKGDKVHLDGALTGKVNIISQDEVKRTENPREFFEIDPSVKRVLYAGDGEVHLHEDVIACTNNVRFAGFKTKRPITPDVVSFPSRVLQMVDEECAIGVGGGKVWIVDGTTEIGFSVRTGNIAVINYAYQTEIDKKAFCNVSYELVPQVQLAQHFGGKGWLTYDGYLSFEPIGNELGKVEVEPISVKGEGKFRIPLSSQYLLDVLNNIESPAQFVLQRAKTVQGTEVDVLRVVSERTQHFLPMDATLDRMS